MPALSYFVTPFTPASYVVQITKPMNELVLETATIDTYPYEKSTDFFVNEEETIAVRVLYHFSFHIIFSCTKKCLI